MADYEVGYGKPPKHSRFQPGESGNPRGRRAGARGIKAEFRRELNELVDITENGKRYRLPKRRVVMKALIAKAAKADVRAANLVIQYMIQLEGLEDQRGQSSRLSQADEQILAHLLGEADGPRQTRPTRAKRKRSDGHPREASSPD